MKFALVVFTLFSQIAFSQQATTAIPSNNVTRVVRIRYGIAQKIAALITGSPGVSVSADNLLKVVVLKGSPESMASVEQTIHELDVPGTGPTSYGSKDVELIV